LQRSIPNRNYEVESEETIAEIPFGLQHSGAYRNAVQRSDQIAELESSSVKVLSSE
jgi:hypothetical protein